jgi:hypothetical protein
LEVDAVVVRSQTYWTLTAQSSRVRLPLLPVEAALGHGRRLTATSREDGGATDDNRSARAPGSAAKREAAARMRTPRMVDESDTSVTSRRRRIAAAARIERRAVMASVVKA